MAEKMYRYIIWTHEFEMFWFSSLNPLNVGDEITPSNEEGDELINMQVERIIHLQHPDSPATVAICTMEEDGFIYDLFEELRTGKKGISSRYTGAIK